MFQWRRQWRIRQARNALRDGRLDEAFAIVTESELRDWRPSQVILERLVDPLIERAEAHLDGGQLEEALADVGRAVEAGGGRPRAAALRHRIEEAMAGRTAARRRARERLASARRHLERGSLRTGRDALEEAGDASAEADRVRREIDARARSAEMALARAEEALARGEIARALEAAAEAMAASPREPRVERARSRAWSAGLAAADEALREGDLARAAALLEGLQPIAIDPPALARRTEALALGRRAARAIAQARFDDARAAAERLAAILPEAPWVRGCVDALRTIAESLLELRSGPLADLEGGPDAAGRRPDPHAETAVSPHGAARPGPDPARPEPARSAHPPRADLRARPRRLPDRLLLWVDGAGSFLLLLGDRITLGRTGSSTRPDVALAGELDGIHAEILRVDEDHFLAARGPVEVNGRRVSEKLLADGDRIALGERARLAFRLPSPLATTAVLRLGGGQRMDGDIREVILLDRTLVFAPADDAHVRLRKGPRAILSVRGDGLCLQAEEGIEVDGRPAGSRAAVPLGSRVRAGELSFAITPERRGR